LELKTPQERSDEEAEAKPTESEVVGLAEFKIQLYTPRIEFVYSLKALLLYKAFTNGDCFFRISYSLFVHNLPSRSEVNHIR
ncbi:hypothetical protein, partial [Psychrobacillus psychrotolerans]|uniref:hypothetical protein n=1 Tax=Psychrobacillus psychrotolerans TaxID=126156 RepID=UPI0033159368